jgi:cytochrome P450
MLSLDVPVREVVGDGYFIPAHPEPHTARPNPVRTFFYARKNLLSVWCHADYRSFAGQVRFLGRQIVIANTPDSVKYVMATRHENFERKSPQMRRALEYLLGDGLFISDGDTWKARRPLVTDIVHKNRLPLFGTTMEAVTGQMAERWARLKPDDEFDLLTEMAELTAEIIARSVFGNRLGAGSAREVIDGFASYQGLVDNFNLPYFLGLDEGMPVFRHGRLRRSVERVHRVVEKVISDHLDGKGDDSSMIEIMMRRQQKNPEFKLDRTALRNEAATIFMAGHETTAATLTWAWYCLSRSPWAEEAMLAEIDRVCGGRAPTVADVPKLDYCRSIIEETLRLYPPVAFLTRQNREADRIGDIDVRPASLILVVPWLLHRASDLWEQPRRFRPERFMQGQRPVPYSYVPFSIGPRICAGLAFGLTESILCLATLAQRFRVTVRPGHKVEPINRLTLRPKNGMPVTLTPRSRT